MKDVTLVWNRSCQFLCADDTVLLGDSEEKFQSLVSEFGRVHKRRKLKVINVL